MRRRFSADVPMVLGSTHDETRYSFGRNAALFSLTWERLPATITQSVKEFIGDLAPVAVYIQPGT